MKDESDLIQAAFPISAEGGTTKLRLRILFLLRDPLPPTRSDVASLFGKYLPRLGVHSDIVGQRSPTAQALAWPAGRAVSCGTLRAGLLTQFMLPLFDAWALRRCRGDYDLVQVRDKIRSALLGWLVARLRGVPFAYWLSFPMAEGFAVTAALRQQPGLLLRLADRLRSRLSRQLLYGFVLPRADHIFVQSDAMRDWLSAKGLARERMTSVPMGVDPEEFRHIEPEPDMRARLAGRRALAHLGVLDRARGSDFMLDVLLALKAHEPAVCLVLAGDAPSAEEAQWIREAIASRGLQDDVLLTGWLPAQQARAWAKCCEVGLSPIPRGELYDVSSPTKTVEYLALGLPAVGNDIPDQEKVLRESGAGLCAPMEVAAFSAAVLRLLREPELARRCSAAGPAWVHRERSCSSIAAVVAQAYDGLTSRKRTLFSNRKPGRKVP